MAWLIILEWWVGNLLSYLGLMPKPIIGPRICTNSSLSIGSIALLIKCCNQTDGLGTDGLTPEWWAMMPSLEVHLPAWTPTRKSWVEGLCDAQSRSAIWNPVIFSLPNYLSLVLRYPFVYICRLLVAVECSEIGNSSDMTSCRCLPQIRSRQELPGQTTPGKGLRLTQSH